MTRIAAVLLILLALGTNRPLQAQTDTPPPYLYYYSQMLGGLIIERADGTDSRQIAADVIPPNLTGLGGPGWSPSGKYFAAYGIVYGDYNTATTTPYLIDLNGKPIADWLNQVNRTSMQWSPTGEDILLVIGDFNKGYKQDNLGSFIWLIDAEQDRVLAEFGVNVAMLPYSMSTITWDTAHQQIVFYLASDTYNVGDHFRVTMHFDGTTLREPVPASSFVPMYKSMDMTSNPDIQTGDNISPSGTYKTHGTHPAQLTDNRTGQTIDLPLHTQATICRDYRWSGDETYMITLDGTLIAGGGCAPAVLGITNPTGTFWRELGSCTWDEVACVGWLPPRVDVRTLPSGVSKPVQLDPVKIEYASGSPVFGIEAAKQPLMRLSCNKDGTANILEAEGESILYTLKYVGCSDVVKHAPLPAKTATLMVAENPTQHLLATYTPWELGVSIWKLNNGVYERLLKLNSQGFTLEFTDHDQYLRARNVNGWKIYSVADILAASRTQND